MFCVLALAENGKLMSISNGDLSDSLGRPSHIAPMIVVDLTRCCIAFVFDGLLKIATIDTGGHVGMVFEANIDVSRAIDVTFVNNQIEMPAHNRCFPANLVCA